MYSRYGAVRIIEDRVIESLLLFEVWPALQHNRHNSSKIRLGFVFPHFHKVGVTYVPPGIDIGLF